jgi:endoglucanase
MKLPYRATTTLYFDTTGGACGCFNTNNKAGYSQQWGIKLGNGETVHMAAGSHSVFNYGSGDGGWCGAACGKCFRLTTTVHELCILRPF